ncbi:MAG: DUF1146 domain-containing protein [Bacilli bacterium]|nr:DUF1146 domain-containing protein [Bacilli bacterium]
MVKVALYITFLIITIWALESIDITGLFKKNRYYESRVLYIIVSMALTYLVVNFIYDFIINARII